MLSWLLAAAVVGAANPALDLSGMKGFDAQVSVNSGVASVAFQPSEWPNGRVIYAQPQDWSGSQVLVLDVENPGRQSISFSVRVDDDVSADGVEHCLTVGGSAPGGKRQLYGVPLGMQPMDVGMRGLPPIPGMVTMGAVSSSRIDRKHIVSWQLFLHQPSKPCRLILHGARLQSLASSLEGVVDRFGQYSGADWPGKVRSEKDLVNRREQEVRQAEPAWPAPERDVYGGWAAGPKLAATGFFRTEKVDGKWWLVTPEGHLFFSTGVDCVSLWGATIVTGRESMFTWLPKENEAFGKFWGETRDVLYGPVKAGRTYDFLQANLLRKYGEDAQMKALAAAVQRLRRWGFNTIGNWSDERAQALHQVPYVVCSHIGGNHRRVSSGTDYWGKMHDPFDPQFRADAAEAIGPTARRVRGDKWCLGWFVDNELSWGQGDSGARRFGLAYGTLREGADSPAKQAFLAQLKAKYGTIEALNGSWESSFGGWSDLEQPTTPASKSTAGRQADFEAFCRSFAEQYFRVVSEELRKADPDHLYMGCRLSWYTPDALEASARFCDVVSFNNYATAVDPKKWTFVEKLEKPAIIGEFHFGALDRGMFHTGLVAAPNQAGRGAMFQRYVRSVLDHPSFVGCHWFQYMDEPLTGRTLDGENCNIGFVSQTDTPYPELVEAAKQVNAEVYRRRAGGKR